MNLFEEKTGKFQPLNSNQIATLNDERRAVYDALVAAVNEVDASGASVESLAAQRETAQSSLEVAQLAESKRPKWTALDEWKSSLRVKKPVSHIPEQNTDVQDAQVALYESHMRLKSAADRRNVALGTLAQRVAAWQVVTGGTMTQDQLFRQHIESETRLRAERVAAARAPVPAGRPGPSAIDQFAFYTKANGRRAGGGRGFARGGVSQVEALRQNAARAAAATAKQPGH